MGSEPFTGVQVIYSSGGEAGFGINNQVVMSGSGGSSFFGSGVIVVKEYNVN